MERKVTEKFPDDYACCDRYVKRMLGAELRKFDSAVGGVSDLLLNAIDFVSEYDSVLCGWREKEMVETDAVFSLFN